MESVLNLGYLDDLTLGGPAHFVASYVARIVQAGGDMGLFLNTSKCELITHEGFVVTDNLLVFSTHCHGRCLTAWSTTVCWLNPRQIVVRSL